MINFPIQYSQSKKIRFHTRKRGEGGGKWHIGKAKSTFFQNRLAPKIGGNHLKSSQVNTHQKAKRGPKNLKTDDQCVCECMHVQMMILMLRTDPGVVYCSRCCVSCNAPSVDQGFLAFYEFAKRCRTVQISIVLFCTVYCTT